MGGIGRADVSRGARPPYRSGMNAEPLLAVVTRALARHRLDVVLIGNAAAALQGAPVTTLDFDFMFRKTTRNLQKLRRLADDLEAVVLRPYYPASELYRVMRDAGDLQLDFMARVDGVRSFEALQSRATVATFGGHELRVAALVDVIRGKQAADRRTVPSSPSSARPSANASGRAAPGAGRARDRRSALRRESDRALVEQIRRLLALPMERRTHFLRRRLPGGGSAL
jgi:hypothetical protein